MSVKPLPGEARTVEQERSSCIAAIRSWKSSDVTTPEFFNQGVLFQHNSEGDEMLVNARMALFCALFVGLSSVALADTLFGKVIAVADGDTITVLDGQHAQHKIRLMGIDSPEKNQPFGQAAKQSLSDLVYGRSVSVEWQKLDRYKRIVGKVMVNGQDANLVQIRRGLAWHYKKYEREQEALERVSYSDAEIEARMSNRGLWSGPSPIPPWDWRKIKKN